MSTDGEILPRARTLHQGKLPRVATAHADVTKWNIRHFDELSLHSKRVSIPNKARGNQVVERSHSFGDRSVWVESMALKDIWRRRYWAQEES